MSQKKKRAANAAAERQRQRAAVRRDAQGNVHLQLLRDPASGQPRLQLAAPIFKDQWQNDVVTATANTALGTLREQPTVAGAVALARNAMTVASQLADVFLTQLPEGTIACRAGCGHCCHQVVNVTTPEALAIVDHLKTKLSPAELALVAARVAEAHERTRGLSSAERFTPANPCPFLESGQCSIYEVRPLACRGMNSRDARGCADVLQDDSARAQFFANALSGYSFAEPIRAFLAISAGLQLSLSALYQLDMRPLELNAAIHLLLSGGGSLPARWLAGEMPFESAHASDEASGERMHELSGLAEES